MYFLCMTYVEDTIVLSNRSVVLRGSPLTRTNHSEQRLFREVLISGNFRAPLANAILKDYRIFNCSVTSQRRIFLRYPMPGINVFAKKYMLNSFNKMSQRRTLVIFFPYGDDLLVFPFTDQWNKG